ncbi:MAG: recombinase family protein, partial [Dehalococcoidia bacterium]
MRIGYARVHVRDHSPDAQHAALEAAGCERIFLDRTHGALASRPELADALLAARPGDELVVTTLDRLAASTRHLIALAGDLQTTGVHLVVLDQGIDTSTPVGHAFFHTLEAVAAFQRALMSDSTLAGLQAARVRGRTGGRK